MNEMNRTAVTAAADAAVLIRDAQGILLDWDGCIAMANRPRADALAFIVRHAPHIAIVSNNSTHLPEDIAAILAKLGVEFPVERIFLAGATALAYTAEAPKTRALVLGTPRMKAWARTLGVTMVSADANAVVLLRDTKFSYARLERAAAALARGARLIVSNTDTSHPGPGGAIVPETGALLAALAACVDLSRVDVHCIGKPSRILFQRACIALKTAPESTVMIGDNLQTDIEGAKRFGMASILVAPGSNLSFAELVDPEHVPWGITAARKSRLAARPQRPTMPR